MVKRSFYEFCEVIPDSFRWVILSVLNIFVVFVVQHHQDRFLGVFGFWKRYCDNYKCPNSIYNKDRRLAEFEIRDIKTTDGLNFKYELTEIKPTDTFTICIDEEGFSMRDIVARIYPNEKLTFLLNNGGLEQRVAYNSDVKKHKTNSR